MYLLPIKYRIFCGEKLVVLNSADKNLPLRAGVVFSEAIDYFDHLDKIF